MMLTMFDDAPAAQPSEIVNWKLILMRMPLFDHFCFVIIQQVILVEVERRYTQQWRKQF